jgi:alkylhydroperoxidase family enzyme
MWIITLLMLAPMLLAGQALPDRPGDLQPIRLTKPRLPPLPEAQWTEAHRKLVAKFSSDGRVGNDFRTLLHVPEIVDAIVPYTIYVSSESSLSARHRELLILRAAWLCGSQYLWSSHAALARKLGLTNNEMRRIALGPDSPGWVPFEATLLRLADQLFRNSSVSDATWKALAADYDLYHLMDATETVNHVTMLSMLYNSFGVQPDAGIAERLPTDVPYRVVVPAREPPPKIARVDPVEGTGLAVTRTLARHPKLSAARAHRANYINRVSPLSPHYRELLILRIGWDCRSEYEWAQHVGSVGRARDHGLDPVRIAEGPGARGWDPSEVALLRAVDELYRDAMISDRTWGALTARFDTKLLMSGMLTASSYRATSMVLNTLGVQLEADNERFPTLPAR